LRQIDKKISDSAMSCAVNLQVTEVKEFKKWRKKRKGLLHVEEVEETSTTKKFWQQEV
jgi:hypothetical protein